jgi:RNA polymerase sigma-70 factor (ECF subfamily)
MTHKEYNTCVDLYADGVYRFVLKNIQNEEDAKDIVQDVFVKMWEKLDTINNETARSYLFTSAYRTMLDKIKKHKPVSIEVTTYREPNHSSTYSDAYEHINNALNQLPEKQKAAVTLRDYEGYNYAEIGKILGMNESQVKVTIFRARKTLKNILGSIEAII